MVTLPHTPDLHHYQHGCYHIDQYSDQGKRHQYFFFFHAPCGISLAFIVRKKHGQFIALCHAPLLPLLLFSENNMQEPLVQHQRPVPGIQDHTLDTIGSQRHAEQLLHICEKSGHYAAASL